MKTTDGTCIIYKYNDSTHQGHHKFSLSNSQQALKEVQGRKVSTLKENMRQTFCPYSMNTIRNSNERKKKKSSITLLEDC